MDPITYRLAPGVAILDGEPPRATTPQGGAVLLDRRLAALLRRADGRSLEDVLLEVDADDLTPLVVRAGLSCLAEAGLLERRGRPSRPSAGRASGGPLVSAVVVGSGGSAGLERLLRSLEAQTHRPREVVVVGGAVADGSAEWLARSHPAVPFVDLPPGSSVAHRVNRGVRSTRGEYLLVVAGNVSLERNAVAEMVSIAAADWRCAAVTPKLLLGEVPGFIAGLGTHLEPGSFSDQASGHLDLGQHDRWDCVPASRFEVALVPSTAWREVGPLDETFRAHEGVEWCLRARALGRHVRAAPGAVALRYGPRPAMGSPGPEGADRDVEGQLRLALKLLAAPEVLGVLRACARRRGRGAAWARTIRDLPGILRSRRGLGGRRASLAQAPSECIMAAGGLRPLAEEPKLTWSQVVSQFAPLIKEGRTRPMPEFYQTRRPVLLVVSQDVVGRRMAGPGIRYLEMATALAGSIDVVLAVPSETSLEVPGISIVQYSESEPSSLQVLVENSDAAVVSGYMFAKFPFLAETSTRLVVDLYDPLVLENLHYYLDDPLDAQVAHNHQAIHVMNAGIRLGDFFLCGTERQRDFWLGVLTSNGRVNPRTHQQDNSLRRLVEVVGMGLPSRPPSAGPGLRGRDPRVPADARVVLWGGGIWNWLDPLTLVKAWPAVVAREPRARLLFLGTRHPNPNVPRHAMAARAQALARETGELDRTIVFLEWVDLSEREALLCDAHVGVSLHPVHVETRYSIRARVIDYFWARLPVVVTGGDVASEWVERYGLGRVVKPDDFEGVAEALVDVLGRTRADWASSFDSVHRDLRWDRVVDPLRRYCLAGAPVAADRARAPRARAPLPPAPPMPLAVRAVDVWRHEGTGGLVRRSFGSLARRLGRG